MLLSVALRPLFLKMRMPCKYPAQRQPVRTFNPQLKCRACGHQMKLALIEPRDRNFELLTYQCAQCDSSESFLMVV
jgi:hypothetical protein